LARVASIVGDLMLASRVRTSLEGAGHEVTQAPTLAEASAGGPELIVADLDAIPPDELAGAGVPVIAFYQHTDAELKRRAGEAGLAVAVPRSRMVRELPELVSRVLDRTR
jgi:hypothetical protein